MKKALLFVLLIFPALALAEKPKPNPSDYTVDIHVQASRIVNQCTDSTNGSNTCYWYQSLKKYELFGNLMPKNAYLLKVGDYKAKIFKEDTSRVYEYLRIYQFLLPDGQVPEYQVTGESE